MAYALRVLVDDIVDVIIDDVVAIAIIIITIIIRYEISTCSSVSSVC